ncbi:hypothetical protein TrRE_jg5977 [Triparma retinervis]|uniref:HMG box domain-containing protein n=1 Tax=Triparma retinervis TaxID=2557542 RepID=A0A9W7CLV6_9STRA|nr:hypothetical protein TrRE_jg5977 [Triparma retinervis]
MANEELLHDLYSALIADDVMKFESSVSKFDDYNFAFSMCKRAYEFHPAAIAASTPSIKLLNILTSQRFGAENFANHRSAENISVLHYAAASKSTRNINMFSSSWIISPLDIALSVNDLRSHELLLRVSDAGLMGVTAPLQQPAYDGAHGGARNSSITSTTSNNSLRGSMLQDAKTSPKSKTKTSPKTSQKTSQKTSRKTSQKTSPKTSPKTPPKTSPQRAAKASQKKKGRQKGRKDQVDKPPKPRKAMSGYNYFFKEKSAEMKALRASGSHMGVFNYGTIGSVMGDSWRKLGVEKKQPYLKKAKLDSERYAKEKEQLVLVFNARKTQEQQRMLEQFEHLNQQQQVAAEQEPGVVNSNTSALAQITAPPSLPTPPLPSLSMSEPVAVSKPSHRKTPARRNKVIIQPGWTDVNMNSPSLSNTPSPTLSDGLPVTTITGIPTSTARPPLPQGSNDDATTATTETRGSKDSFSLLSDVAFAMENSDIRGKRKQDSSTSTTINLNDAGSLSSYGTINSSTMITSGATINRYQTTPPTTTTSSTTTTAASRAAAVASSISLSAIDSSVTIFSNNPPLPSQSAAFEPPHLPHRGSMNSFRSSGTGNQSLQLGFDFSGLADPHNGAVDNEEFRIPIMKWFRGRSKDKNSTSIKKREDLTNRPSVSPKPLSAHQLRSALSGDLQAVEAVNASKSQTIIFSRTQSYPDDEGLEMPKQLRAVAVANPNGTSKPIEAKRKSSKKFDSDTKGDRSVWKETYHIRKQRYFYRNLATNRCVWDEPPSGTRHIWYLDDETYEYRDSDGTLAAYAASELHKHVDVFFDTAAVTTTLYDKANTAASRQHQQNQPILNVASTFEDVAALPPAQPDPNPNEASTLTLEEEVPS